MSFFAWLLFFVQLVVAAPTSPRPVPEMTVAADVGLAPQIEAPPGGWWQEDGLYVRVHSDLADRRTARALAQHANVSGPNLARKLEVALGPLIEVYVAPTQEAFSKIQPGHPPDWADGTAWPNHGLVFLRAPSLRTFTTTPLTTVLDHELVHIILGRAFSGRPVPRWLQEGVAEVYSGEVGPARASQVLATLSAGELMPLDQLSRGFPADAVGARVAYAQSVDLVTFLSQTYGPSTIPRLARAAAAGAGFSESLMVATGEDPRQVEQRWKARWESPWRKVLLLADMNLVFAVVALFAGVGLYRVRRRTRQRLARWEEEERMMMFTHPQVN